MRGVELLTAKGDALAVGLIVSGPTAASSLLQRIAWAWP